MYNSYILQKKKMTEIVSDAETLLQNRQDVDISKIRHISSRHSRARLTLLLTLYNQKLLEKLKRAQWRHLASANRARQY